MKKLLSAIGFGLTTLALKAQQATDEGIIGTADVKEIFTKAQSNMTTLIDDALPVVIAFVIGGLTIWAAIALIGIIKRAFGAGKGR